MKTGPIVIVGAGPAGMSAAITLVKCGLHPIVVDENPRCGGQYFRQAAPQFSATRATSEAAVPGRSPSLCEEFESISDQIRWLNECVAWGVFPSRNLAVHYKSASQLLNFDHLILANGAYEYVPPFPGWTLPGVMTPGGAQALWKSQRIRAGRRVLLAGTGPFLLVVALQLHAAGVHVAGIVETARRRDLILQLPRLCSDPATLLQGMSMVRRVRRSGIPIVWGSVVVRACGDGELSRVIVARCDKEGYPRSGTEREFQVDTLGVGYGFVPRIELAQLAGCALEYSAPMGGWYPRVSAEGESSVPTVWIAGDGGGIAGAKAAEWMGELVALSIAQRRQSIPAGEDTGRRTALLARLRKWNRFRGVLERAYPIRPGLTSLAKEDTLVCRCEDLSLAKVLEGFEHSGGNARSLKVATRLSMGPCQGKMCWPALTRWLAENKHVDPHQLGPTNPRPPIVPICLGDLCDDQEQAPLQLQARHE